MNREWETALRYWSAAVPFQYELVDLADFSLPHKPGDWWRDGDEWLLQLDKRRAVRIAASAITEELRRALAWTVLATDTARSRTWRDVLLAWFQAELGQTLTGAHTEAVGLPPAPDELRGLAKLLPGHFVWMHPSHARTHDPLTAASGVEQVIRAVLPHGWIGWLGPVGDSLAPSLLVFCSDSEVTGADSEDPGDSSFSRDYQQFLQVRQTIESALAHLETDAFFAARAVIGSRVESGSDWSRGLRTLVNTWRVQQRYAPQHRVAAFAEMPVEHLLASMPDVATQLFAELVAHRASNAAMLSTEELTETLHGIVAGNLNISEAARLLFLHRNTLLNRIEKIRQHTGYDLRNFQDVVTLWLYQRLTMPGDDLDRPLMPAHE